MLCQAPDSGTLKAPFDMRLSDGACGTKPVTFCRNLACSRALGWCVALVNAQLMPPRPGPEVVSRPCAAEEYSLAYAGTADFSLSAACLKLPLDVLGLFQRLWHTPAHAACHRPSTCPRHGRRKHGLVLDSSSKSMSESCSLGHFRNYHSCVLTKFSTTENSEQGRPGGLLLTIFFQRW